MSCSCHGKKGEKVSGTVLPDDPCLACAAKHIEMALAAWGEFTYEMQARRFCAGHVRLAVEHTKAEHRTLALTLRDIAVAIEDAADTSVTDIRSRLLDASAAIQSLLDTERPSIRQRLDALMANLTTDIIIPLGSGSKSDNDELRILLRSLEANAIGLGRIIVISDCAPSWLDRSRVTVLKMGDAHAHNKDANLIDKTIAAIREFNLDSFCWFADDNVLMQPLRLSAIPILRNLRSKSDFADDGKWHRRVFRTFEWAESLGVHLTHNYETHVPQYFTHARELASRLATVDYRTPPGLSIMTLFRVLLGETSKPSESQDAWKETYQEDCTGKPITLSKPFVGYNDTGFLTGLRQRLFEIYPTRSIYES